MIRPARSRARRRERIERLVEQNTMLQGMHQRKVALIGELHSDRARLRDDVAAALRAYDDERASNLSAQAFRRRFAGMVDAMSTAHDTPPEHLIIGRGPEESGRLYYERSNLRAPGPFGAAAPIAAAKMRSTMALMRTEMVRERIGDLIHLRVRLAGGQASYGISDEALRYTPSELLAETIAPELARLLVEDIKAAQRR
jgi:hypothetical protein